MTVSASFPNVPSLHERFEARVRETPDAVALVCGDSRLTYAELNARSNRLAHRLRKLGVGPDAIVALNLQRSIDTVIGTLGVLKAGGAYLPLDPAYPADRLAFMLEDSGAKVLVTHADVAATPPLPEGVAVIPVASAEDQEDGDLGVAVGPQHLAYVIYTSGSTGKPKGVLVTQGNVVRLFTATDAWFHFGRQDVWTFFHSHAFDFSVWEIWGALIYGGRLIVVPYTISRSPESFHDLLVREQVTVLNQTPSAFRQLMHVVLQEKEQRPLALRTVIFGGEALELQGLRPWFERFGDQRPQLVNMYGITETTVHVTYRPLTMADTRGKGSVIGVPIPDLGLHLLDEKLQPVPVGEPGEIFVEGAGLARGYLNRAELTAERFPTLTLQGRTARLYRTGDSARRTEDGELEYLGRIDLQVKIRGFRIELGEIESVIAQHPGVREVVVIPREDNPGDKRLVAYVASSEPAETLVEALRARLREHVPEYMVPAAFVLLPTLPLTENGKVDRRALPAPTTARPALATEFVEPEGATELAIAAIWRRMLRLDRVGANDSFFDLGGSSLLAVESLRELRQSLGRTAPVVALFRRPTVRGLAAELDGGADGALSSVDVRARAERQLAGRRDAIAIIGMSGRFPGAATVGELWANLCAGKEGVRFFTAAELDPRAAEAGTASYVAARGVIEDADKFDAPFFGESPAAAAITDPQQRVLLETTWAALEDAGVVPGKHGATIGVYAGTGHNTYLLHNVVARPDRIEALGELQIVLANDKDFVATRIAHKLDLQGPALSVHTACSTSLVAICLATRGLLDHDCDIAVGGGASVTVPINAGHRYVEGSMLSSDGHTRTFDAKATGTVFSDAAGAVVLKRLSDAERDGDRIYAVIRGTALNNDGGAKASFSAPSVDGQAKVIALAHAVADIDPRTISYVEAHGTATPLGDPIEVAALTRAFRMRTPDRGFCAIGSIKSNIGHATAASGVAGVIKTALALHHEKLPPSLHFERPNPDIDFDATPFVVQTKLEDWPAHAGKPNGKPATGATSPRRAGVSSFGVGGTNAHIVLEEAPPPVTLGPSRGAQLLLLATKSEAALGRAAERLGQHLVAHPAEALADVAYTLQCRRSHFAHRRFVVAATNEEARAALAAAPDAASVRRLERGDAKPSFIFPGQGTQYAGMGRGLYDREPVFRAAFDRCADAARAVLGRDLRTVCFDEPAATAAGAAPAGVPLDQTMFTQPALFSIEYALATLWRSWGVEPAALVGHSVGEFVAACLAGVFGLEDAVSLVATRGALMQALPAGSMLSVRMSAEKTEPLLSGGLGLAASNGPELCVVSGPTNEVDAFEAKLTADGLVSRRLRTSHAFHSSMMDPVVEPFTARVAAVKPQAPRIPIISTATGRLLTAEEATSPGYWAHHLRAPVRFVEALRTLMADRGAVLLEVGPRATSTTLARQVARTLGPAAPRDFVSSLRDQADAEPTALLHALGQLWLGGVAVDWEAYQSIGRRRLLSLPTYPFARDRHWLDPERKASTETAAHTSAATAPAATFVPAVAPPPSRAESAEAPTVVFPAAPAWADDGMAPDGLQDTLLAQLGLMSEQLRLLSE